MIAILLLTAVVAVFARWGTAKPVPIAGVGNNPGDILSGGDLAANAGKRGNQVAVFAAG